jgi:hypothetical protein
MPQLAGFINQFDTMVVQQNINVITDVEGNLSIQVPFGMSDAVAQKAKIKVEILDRLINTRASDIKDLLHKGLALHKEITTVDPSYKSEIMNQITEFKKLNSSYKH